MTVRSPPPVVAAAACLLLAGCVHEAVDFVALGMIGLVGLFVASLFIVPVVQDLLSRREHNQRMYNRTPFARPHENAPPRRRRRRKG